MKKSLTLFFIFTGILLGWIFYHNNPAKSSWQDIKRGPVISAIYGLGTVTSDKIYHLKVAVPTHIKALYVHEGDEVKTGQPLALLNGLPLVRAGFDGTITALPLNQDENLLPNAEVLTLMDLRHCYVLVSLEQEAAVKIRKGQQVKLSFSGLPDQNFQGIVTSLYPKAQETYVKITVNKLPTSILPQMSSDVAIVLEEKSNAMLVPINAIQQSTITVRRRGKIIKVPIQVGAVNDDYVEVISNDLTDNDQILVKG